MTKERRQLGTIEQRAGWPPTKWLLRVTVVHDSGTRGEGSKVKRQVRPSRVVNAPNRRAAERLLRDFEKELQAGYERGTVGVGRAMTLAQWSREWLITCEGKLAFATTEHYHAHLVKRIIPALGNKLLSSITAADVHKFLYGLRDALKGGHPISEATRMRVFRTFSSCLQEAVYRGLLETNPCRQVRPPAPKRKEARYYSEAEVARMVEAVSADPEVPFRVMVMLALASGARRGELAALEWRHVNWDSATITIEQACESASGYRGRVKTTKTGVARTVPVGAFAMALLADLRARQMLARESLGDDWMGETGHDFVFTTEGGFRLKPDYVTRRFGAMVRRHGLPALTFHGLRHTAASLMVLENVPLSTVSQMLGHLQTQTTANLYTHVLQSSKRRAADILDRYLTGDLVNGLVNGGGEG
jgi:integrase